MAGTRSSTRQKASAAPKYNEDLSSSAEEAQSKGSTTKSTRRKRTREDEDDNDVADASQPPPKKIAPSKSKASKASTTKEKAPAKAPKASEPATSKSKPAPPPEPTSPSNRDANGNQEVFWLLKAEPLPRYENGINVAFSISDLRACTSPEPWSGVRNPQARNNMQAMRKGDLGFFYHSNAKPSGVVGILRVVQEAFVDETAFDPKDPYHDAKSQRDNPKWYCVGVEFVKEFERVVDLHEIKGFAGGGGPLRDMQLVTNSRLSVCRVRKEEWEFILGLAEGGKGEEKDVEKKA
ncbi:hypothetical protein COCCADRAFT_24315 [Bipolaris zeicola 26-R-13]|uniref:Thymocyte nuclear protein 1 n=1 Tax=Cochliobolus carbonum (strain 26-R-13) TaxID=930089 RepID=W6YJJ5_COCC2|nr:uncharacterized protein COCCADRAFT_24315 [Bipolaris zeicola 26-R-13]EUC35754.1 hypothetical protein COCCADRAFT_24315 [Bipolaris zeicola 26-R-13]